MGFGFFFFSPKLIRIVDLCKRALYFFRRFSSAIFKVSISKTVSQLKFT